MKHGQLHAKWDVLPVGAKQERTNCSANEGSNHAIQRAASCGRWPTRQPSGQFAGKSLTKVFLAQASQCSRSMWLASFSGAMRSLSHVAFLIKDHCAASLGWAYLANRATLEVGQFTQQASTFETLRLCKRISWVFLDWFRLSGCTPGSCAPFGCWNTEQSQQWGFHNAPCISCTQLMLWPIKIPLCFGGLFSFSAASSR